MSDEQIVDGSVQGYIRSAMRKSMAREIEKVPVPQFQGKLVLRCQALEPRALIKMGIDVQEAANPVDGVIDASVDALLAACVGSESDRGEDLGVPLGAALATTLGLTEGTQLSLDPQAADREAVFLVFGNEAEIVAAANSLQSFQQLVQEKANNEIVGNSGAAMA